MAEVVKLHDRKGQQQGSGPKVEEGFTRIASELFDAILIYGFTGRQLAVLMTVIRKTYGYNKSQDDMSASQIGEACGVARNHVSEALGELSAMNVIHMRRGEFGMVIGLNKHYREWMPKESGRTASPKKGLAESSPKTGLKLVPNREESSPKTGHTIDNRQKTTPIDKKPIAQSGACAAGFVSFWDAFGLKKDRKKAEAAFAAAYAAAPDPEGWLAQVLAAAKAEAERRPYLIAQGRTPIYAQGWLSGRRWEDEDLATWGRFTERQQAFIDVFNANIGGLCLPVDEWSEARAALADAAASGRWSLETWARFWRKVAERCEFRGTVSFEWLLRRENFVRVKGGEFGDLS
jgi:phage replication O-like protein O